jgi:hypothetical protein
MAEGKKTSKEIMLEVRKAVDEIEKAGDELEERVREGARKAKLRTLTDAKDFFSELEIRRPLEALRTIDNYFGEKTRELYSAIVHEVKKNQTYKQTLFELIEDPEITAFQTKRITTGLGIQDCPYRPVLGDELIDIVKEFPEIRGEIWQKAMHWAEGNYPLVVQSSGYQLVFELINLIPEEEQEKEFRKNAEFFFRGIKKEDESVKIQCIRSIGGFYNKINAEDQKKARNELIDAVKNDNPDVSDTAIQNLGILYYVMDKKGKTETREFFKGLNLRRLSRLASDLVSPILNDE